jgi:FtsH-binding integral membrane protein
VTRLLRRVTALLLGITLVVQLASVGSVVEAVAVSRPRLPDSATLLSLIWLLPSVAALVAGVLVLRGRAPGRALGWVVASFVWVGISLVLVVEKAAGETAPVHVVLLLLLAGAVAGTVAGFEELRARTRLNRLGRALFAIGLVVAAVVLRVYETSAPGALLVAVLVPVLVGVPAALLWFGRAQAQALSTVVALQLAYEVVVRVGLVYQGTVTGDLAARLSESLLYLAGTACLLLAVIVGQRLPRSR